MQRGTLSGSVTAANEGGRHGQLQGVLDDLRDRFAASTTAPINSGTLSQPSTLSFIGEDVAAAAASATPVAPTVAAPGAPYSAMYVFGDSLSDTGNVSLATFGLCRCRRLMPTAVSAMARCGRRTLRSRSACHR